ncbi:hypothetical protein LTS08_001282 [Lithohypha guttulata]|nr:hypothetical protein LTS08_001282 [Lithohypha guttulata]
MAASQNDLLRLPAEIRLMIYGNLCPSIGETNNDTLPLLQTCKATYMEMLPLVYQKKLVVVDCPATNPLKELRKLISGKKFGTVISQTSDIANTPSFHFCPATHIRHLEIRFPPILKRKRAVQISSDTNDYAAVGSYHHSTINLPAVVAFLRDNFPQLQTLVIRAHRFGDLINDETGVPHWWVVTPLCCLSRQKRLAYLAFKTTIGPKIDLDLLPPGRDAALVPLQEIIRAQDFYTRTYAAYLCALGWVLQYSLMELSGEIGWLVDGEPTIIGVPYEHQECPLHDSGPEDAATMVLKGMVPILQWFGVLCERRAAEPWVQSLSPAPRYSLRPR